LGMMLLIVLNEVTSHYHESGEQVFDFP